MDSCLRRALLQLHSAEVATTSRTIANLWRNATAEGRPGAAYLHEVDGEWREVTWAEAAETVDELANGLLALGVQKGASFATPRPNVARVGALRLRPRPGRGRRGADLRQQLRARHPVRARALGRRRRARRGRRAAGEGRGAAARERDRVRGARRAARPRPRLRRGAPDGTRRARRLDRRGRPVHLHLHVGNDRPAEGVHDPPPQLLRDGAEGRRDGGPPDGARRRDAALPPARPQLRPPAASLGGVHRLHDRVLARSAACGDGAGACAADAVPERAARLREDPHGGRDEVRRSDGRHSAS